MKKILLLVASLLIATSAEAGKQTKNVPTLNTPTESELDKARMTYVESNVLATLYHEFAHALIDKLPLPVFGREEDAADTFVVVITDKLFSEARAEHITWASADQYARDAEEAAKKGYELAVWDLHSLDLVRYYNLLCLFYGGNPDTRDDFAEEYGLPEGRAETCEEERDLADKSWGAVLEDIKRIESGQDWITIGKVDPASNPYVTAAQQVIRDEVTRLNKVYAPNFRIKVHMEDCGEVNAFYQPGRGDILMCNELSRSYVHQ